MLDMQLDKDLRVTLSNAQSFFHLIQNVGNEGIMNTACKAIIDKNTKDQATVSTVHIYTWISSVWNQLVTGEETIDFLVPYI